MPSMRQPKPLRMLCVTSASELVINQVLYYMEQEQESNIKISLYKYIPPLVIQEVQIRVIQLLGTKYATRASPDLISSLLLILLHPNLTEIHLSELSYIGNVELDSLDVVERAIMLQLPHMTHLTYADLSTHRFKITYPSCSDNILELIGTFCPHLTVLNLNFNNRVTGEGLLHLYPSDNHCGCIKLEKLFILGCSVEPEDVALLICSFPNLQIIGYKELGTSLHILKSRPKRYGQWNLNNQLKLTHVDNTMSGVQRCDGAIVDFLGEACPCVENLKVRVHDEDLNRIRKLDKLKHLELRYCTGIHHPVGSVTETYLMNYGSYLASFTIYCNILYSQVVLAVAENCIHLKKLFLHANIAVLNIPLASSKNKLQKLELLNVRLGDDELVMNPAACDLVLFLIRDTPLLQELYIMVRSPGFHHTFVCSLLEINPFAHLKNLIIDVPRRTLAAPMLELSMDTASVLIERCVKLKILGNLICWDVTQEQVSELRSNSRRSNYNLTILHARSNKLNTKYL